MTVRPPLPPSDLSTAEARLALAIEYSPALHRGLGEPRVRRAAARKPRTSRSKHFSRARDLNPDLPAPHHALGALADRRGEGHARREALSRGARRSTPAFVAARVNLARRLFERGAFEDAREQFLRLTQVQA